MNRVVLVCATLSVLTLGGSAWGQEDRYPIMDRVAQKVV